MRQIFNILKLSCLLMVFAFSAVAHPPLDKPTSLAQAISATFLVQTNDLEQRLLGSGFLFGENRIVMTNDHVVGAEKTVRLVASDGRTAIAKVISRDKLRDIAILQIMSDTFDNLRPIQVAKTAPELGQVIFAIGAPYGADFSLSRGIVSALGRQIEANVPIRMIQHDAAVNPGSSGGPLVDAKGQLIGMNSQIADGFRSFIGIAYAIPAGNLVRVRDAMNTTTQPPMQTLGLRVRPVSPRIGAALEMGPASGILVDHVMAGGIAEAAGVQAGDIMVSLGNQPLTAPGDLAFALEHVAMQDVVDLKVLRGKRIETLSVQVSQKPDLKAAPEARLPLETLDYSMSDIGLQLSSDGRILSVTQNSLAHFEGLSAGDQIIAINSQDLAKNGALLADFRIQQPALVLVALSDGSTRHFVLDPWRKPGRLRPVSGANVLDEEIVIF